MEHNDNFLDEFLDEPVAHEPVKTICPLWDNYIVFLLGADDFGKITDKIHDIGLEFGMDQSYECCMYIAKKFEQYDNQNYNIMSKYDSLTKFLYEYENEIMAYLIDNKDFKVVMGEY